MSAGRNDEKLLDDQDEQYRAQPNKSLHWIFTPLRSVKTSELLR